MGYYECHKSALILECKLACNILYTSHHMYNKGEDNDKRIEITPLSHISSQIFTECGNLFGYILCLNCMMI